MGKFIEGMMEPSVLRWVKEGLKLTLKEVARNKELYQDGKSVGEIDLFMEGEREWLWREKKGERFTYILYLDILQRKLPRTSL
jgi:predicted RecB family endonuclease